MTLTKAFLKWRVKVFVAQSCPNLCNPMNCSLPGSSVHGILQARVLERVAILSKGSSQPTDWTKVSCIAGRFFTVWAMREAHLTYNKHLNTCWGRERKKERFSLDIS